MRHPHRTIGIPPSLALVRLRFATGFGNVAPAFAHRNYRVYVSGNAVGLIGTWLQRVSVGWLAWTLTHSGAWLGIMSMAEFFPVVFLSPLAGVLADRRNQVSVIRTTQVIGGLQASVLAVLVYSGAITIEWLFALTLLLGITNSFAQPSRMALISNLVDRAALPSALAINSIVFNSARFIGPAIAGLVIAQASVGAAFALNAATYIIFFTAMTRLHPVAALSGGAGRNVLRASAEAYSYVSRHPGIAPMLLLFTVTTIATRGYIELFPGFADDVFQRGAAGLSVLVSTVGLGAICGGAWMLLRPGLNGLTSVVLGHTLVISLAILGFTATDQFYVALPFVFVAGTAMVITGVGAQTLIQASVEPQMRGRVMALYGMIFRAGPALGAVLMGSLSERFGLRLPLAVGAVISVVVCALTWARQRRIAPLLESEPSPRGQAGPAAEKGAP
jgi:predicted MFS family arabinose efflux permease